jgi:hypothetical protein
MSFHVDMVLYTNGNAVQGSHDLSRTRKVSVELSRAGQRFIDKQLDEAVCRLQCDGCSFAVRDCDLLRSELAQPYGGRELRGALINDD